MMKGNKGITLIALIITIIVLLILAGVTIAMLMGPHGILTQADDAKVTTIEGTVDERVRLSVQAARIGIANKAAADNSYNATTNDCADVVRWIGEDLNGDSWNVSAEGSTVTIVYQGADYESATGKGEGQATITYTVTVSEQALTLSDPTFVPAHRS